jgi:hypothetical protein
MDTWRRARQQDRERKKEEERRQYGSEGISTFRSDAKQRLTKAQQTGKFGVS